MDSNRWHQIEDLYRVVLKHEKANDLSFLTQPAVVTRSCAASWTRSLPFTIEPEAFSAPALELEAPKLAKH